MANNESNHSRSKYEEKPELSKYQAKNQVETAHVGTLGEKIDAALRAGGIWHHGK